MNTSEMIEKLKELAKTSQYVSLINEAQNQDDYDRVQISAKGLLEMYEVDGAVTFYVRVKDCYHGCSGINFTPKHVRDLYRQTYLWEITLR